MAVRKTTAIKTSLRNLKGDLNKWRAILYHILDLEE